MPKKRLGNFVKNWDSDYSKLNITYTEDPKTPADVSMMASYESVLSIIRKYKPDAKTIVEVGCGSARNSIYLAKNGYEVCGLDYSNEAIKLAHANAASLSLDIPLFEEDLFNPSHKQKYDVVMSFGLLEHFKDLNSITNAVNHYCKPGGLHIHVIIPKRFSTDSIVNIIYYPFKFLKRFITGKLDGILVKSFRDFPHYENNYSVRQYKKSFENAGLTSLNVYAGSLFYPFFALPRPFNKLITKIFSKIMFKIFIWTNRRTNRILVGLSQEFTYVGINNK